ncbi:hypothetical protein Tco_0940179 [Tanacetum coccineum]|uniref:Uncharacterized protein n=1 Tax=Tanacetum coccineum TaxID=301880 RepID=A0ABQ5DU03_9ASTR
MSSGGRRSGPRPLHGDSSDNGGVRQMVLEKSMKNLEQAREKNKEIFEETLEQERKLNEENFESFKKETNDKLAEALA